jgi:hypothetical protein
MLSIINRLEEQKLMDAKRLAEHRKREDEKQIKREVEKGMEHERGEDRVRQDELRKRDLERLEQMRLKALQQQQQSSRVSQSKGELKYYSSSDARPGNTPGFGFGSVTTGQVSIIDTHTVTSD